MKHAKNSYDEMCSRMERDHFMTPEEAKTLGIIDHVLEHPPETVSDSNPSSSSPASGKLMSDSDSSESGKKRSKQSS